LFALFSQLTHNRIPIQNNEASSEYMGRARASFMVLIFKIASDLVGRIDEELRWHSIEKAL